MRKIKTLFIILIFFAIQHNSFAINEETLILFDSTASMLEPFGSSPKYVTAIKETKEVLSLMPPNTAIGLRIIGLSLEDTLKSLSIPEHFCKATSLLEPIKPFNIKSINNRLDTLFPLGTTPLTYSLDLAIKNDFSQYSQKHIILITDGAESCDADPCGFIQNLMRTRNDIKIDVISIGISENDLMQLNCLTNYTSGTLINVNTPTEFRSALDKILKPQINEIKEQKKEIKNIDEKFYNEKDVIYKNYLLVE